MNLNICLLFLLVGLCSASEDGCFRAAVLDHVMQQESPEDDIRLIAERNLNMLTKAAEIAKQNDADIVVFPENGVWNDMDDRQLAWNISETIPNSAEILCHESSDRVEVSVATRLSCLARKHSIFLVADTLEKQPCDAMKVSKDHCPKDGMFLFNTGVVFDREGRLIGKYHKMHLFSEQYLNTPPRDEMVIMDTELGRLGIQICFDMIYEKPGRAMAQQKSVDTILYPTWWYNESPLLNGAQFQMAWSITNQVNLLASNIHKIEIGSLGSGIYSGIQNNFVIVNAKDRLERLIVANVPKSITSSIECDSDSKVIVLEQEIPIQSVDYKEKLMNFTGIKLVPISLDSDSQSVCHEGVCCSVEYKFHYQEQFCDALHKDCSDSCASESGFCLVASNRTRPGVLHRWAEEICALIQCPEDYPDRGCSLARPESNQLELVKLRGEFSSEASVYPSAVGPDNQPIFPHNTWNFSGSAREFSIDYSQNNQLQQSLQTLSLYGRVYSRDPPFRQTPNDRLQST